MNAKKKRITESFSIHKYGCWARFLCNPNWPNIFGIIYCLYTVCTEDFFSFGVVWFTFSVVRINTIENTVHYYYFEMMTTRDAQLAYENTIYALASIYITPLVDYPLCSIWKWQKKYGPCCRSQYSTSLFIFCFFQYSLKKK